MDITRPLLAANLADKQDGLGLINWPMYGSIKLDGIRCLMLNGKAHTRSFKPIRNNYVRRVLETELKGMWLDGELIVPGGLFSTTSSIMSELGKPKFTYYVFDELSRCEGSYRLRYEALTYLTLPPFVQIVRQVEIRNIPEFLDFEQQIVEQGHEGVIIRSPRAAYKCGRSTFNEQILIKAKRAQTEEATIVGYVQKEVNSNEQTLDNFGLAKRSSKQEGQTLVEELGALEVLDSQGRYFKVGSGFTLDQRKQLWYCKSWLLGKTITFKHYPQGVKDLPRSPIFISLRPKEDQDAQT